MCLCFASVGPLLSRWYVSKVHLLCLRWPLCFYGASAVPLLGLCCATDGPLCFYGASVVPLLCVWCEAVGLCCASATPLWRSPYKSCDHLPHSMHECFTFWHAPPCDVSHLHRMLAPSSTNSRSTGLRGDLRRLDGWLESRFCLASVKF